MGIEQYNPEELIAEAERQLVRTSGETEKINLICLDDVEEEETEWLVYPYIPRGKITLCAAYPGAGKTFLVCGLSSSVSTGQPFLNITVHAAEGENVVYLTTEDGLGDTIKKRLRMCGANMKKIFSYQKTSELTFDSPKIKEIIEDAKPALLVFDPFQSFIGENVELNAANKTRVKLEHIRALAEEYNVAVILICHFNKNQKGDAITRIIGSTDIVGISRSYLAIGNVPNMDKIKFMSHEKSSLAECGKTILFQINPDEGGIKYIGETDKTMDDYTREAYENRKHSAPALEAAKEFIRNQMPEGKRPAKEIQTLAEANRISSSTLNRAKDALGIVTERDGFGGPCIWVLPRDMA